MKKSINFIFMFCMLFLYAKESYSSHILASQREVLPKSGSACECVNEKQIHCDEYKSKNTSVGKANGCWDDCNCTIGRECIKINKDQIIGYCQDKKGESE